MSNIISPVKSSKMKQMATNPSCDACAVRNTVKAVAACEKFMESWSPYKVEGKKDVKYCLTNPTPYICFNGEDAYIACSLQGTKCPNTDLLSTKHPNLD
jgi:hypothetical protein